ncbi:MAG: threonylcarbamoyl-AMP synthase [Verrucomicrobia bacterium]|nr:threonylcarbamoyl-AMP synthase [Verrucomicrobiota bacterium]
MDRTELLNSSEIIRAAELLRIGKLVSFPTETVYGLGACIFNPEAIQSIFSVKGRPSDNPLIAHVSAIEQVSEIAEQIPDAFSLLTRSFFPGPLTVILRRRSHVPSIVSAGLDTIAVRMPSHPLALKLIELAGEPLVAPSANLSGKPSATQAKHVLEDFEGKIAAVLDGGKTEFGIESTVISLIGEMPILMRPGSISKEAIEEVLKCPVGTASADLRGPVSSPGMKYRHYSPRTPVKVLHTLQDLESYLAAMPVQGKTMLLSRKPIAHCNSGIDLFSLTSKELYSLLRLADENRYQQIVIFCDEDVRKEDALMNRLTRAAGG